MWSWINSFSRSRNSASDWSTLNRVHSSIIKHSPDIVEHIGVAQVDPMPEPRTPESPMHDNIVKLYSPNVTSHIIDDGAGNTQLPVPPMETVFTLRDGEWVLNPSKLMVDWCCGTVPLSHAIEQWSQLYRKQKLELSNTRVQLTILSIINSGLALLLMWQARKK